MREIKFRAWDTETKEMSYDYLAKNWLLVAIESPYMELMQYTGLKDKDGREIYEGDQLFAPGNLTNELEYIGDVVWDENDARWEVENFHGRFEYVPNGEVVVQGNIYENAELIKSTE